MTAEEAVSQLKNLSRDPEEAHGKAEDILLEFLSSQGFGEVSMAFSQARDSIGFWYA